ncbi:disintegrin and metalloproteinase domain-containing protein 19-like [Sinocyclocheilus rhinocerous]|uniref:disintegrin and metalloproteinase domain-containing protein 19-like n=1 Tax=Sinocyclocheilus rhinocerous TaxID=307959 RepID=UPI0007B84075|nr:PREDICTED: disintegrin and metalloproteinase domain-containing protein 19-like [Sinocyclocheilus rhinocerous]
MYTKHRQKNGHISSTRYVLVMLSVFLFNGLLEIVSGNPREEVEDRGQRVAAHWISHRTAQQEAETSFKDQFPERGEILVSAQDLKLVLQVERNQELLGHDFTETHYENGLPVTQTSSHTDHCFYHGRVRGHAESWVALSTCLGMRGLIGLNSNDTYYLEPIRGQEVLHHTFYRTEDLPIKTGTCGHSHQTGHISLFSGHLKPLHQRVSHGVIFKGTTIGMAPLEGMCSHENSGGINVDHSELPIGAAATMAHEIGHNIGMSHDHEGCCVEATAEQGGCVMAAATGHPFPKVFSRCSKKDLDNYFQKGGGMCLFNMPNMKDLVGGKRCGNGFVEEGEECDCGEPEECTNDCCHPSNCTLKMDAQCAHGVCCEDCKLKQAGTMCRGAAGACDLPEYCTGGSPYCPSNVYLLDGSSCQLGRAYCYNGMCLTHEQQCLQLWGYGAQPAHDVCFQDVNAAGNAFGNCGKDSHGNYMKCEKSDAKCGKIQCHSAAKKPKGTNAVSIDTTIRTDGIEVKCRGTYVYSTQDGQGDLPDPGLVMTGTKCGEGKVCKDRQCQNASFTELQTCIARCHGHGVCNSNGNCHCKRGWAPPFCEKPGLGGSVDSGPIQYDSQVGLVVGLLFVFLVLLPAVLIAFYCIKIKSSYYHKWKTQREKSKASRNEGSVEKGKNGHLNPAFHLKVVGPSNRSVNLKLPHTSKEVLPLRPNPASNSTQPVNIVRPLRPAPSPSLSNIKGPRPPPPISKPPKSVASPQKLSPPKKPLPLNPSRSPLKVSEQQPRPPFTPPQRPLPLSPARGAQPKPSGGGLMVMMPPSVGPKPVGKVTAVPPLKAFRPVSGPKPIIVPSTFRK